MLKRLVPGRGHQVVPMLAGPPGALEVPGGRLTVLASGDLFWRPWRSPGGPLAVPWQSPLAVPAVLAVLAGPSGGPANL